MQFMVGREVEARVRDKVGAIFGVKFGERAGGDGDFFGKRVGGRIGAGVEEGTALELMISAPIWATSS